MAALFCSAPEMARALGVPRFTLLQWIRSGAIRAVQLSLRHYSDERPTTGKRVRWYVPISEVERVLALAGPTVERRLARQRLALLGERRARRCVMPPTGGPGGSEGG